QEHEDAEQQNGDHDRRQPPLFVVAEKMPELRADAGPPFRLREIFEVAHPWSTFVPVSLPLTDRRCARCCADHRLGRYLMMHRMADTPSRQPIFLPSSYVRPSYEIPTSKIRQRNAAIFA